MFCSKVGFSGTADLMALFPVRINSKWRPPPSWIISNGQISATAHDLLLTPSEWLWICWHPNWRLHHSLLSVLSVTHFCLCPAGAATVRITQHQLRHPAHSVSRESVLLCQVTTTVIMFVLLNWTKHKLSTVKKQIKNSAPVKRTHRTLHGL